MESSASGAIVSAHDHYPVSAFGPRGPGLSALTSYVLGLLGAASLIPAVLEPALAHWSAYAFVLVFFHELEYLLTAAYRPDTLSFDNFLLNHSRAYGIATLACWAEFWLEWWLLPRSWTQPNALSVVGAVAMLVALYVRALAMRTAGQNFSHLIEESKRPEHDLVQHGVYRYLRHPAYFGFFWFSVSTQLLLLNPVCALLYAYASWSFFADRIPYEEALLHGFFPEKYAAYCKRTMVGIPFIRAT